MRIKQLAPGVLAGVLIFGGVACSEENDTSETEDLSPELDGGEGEEGVVEGEEEEEGIIGGEEEEEGVVDGEEEEG